MTTASTQHRAELSGQIVVVAGGSAGIGLEIGARARAGLGALSSASFNADPAAPGRFSDNRPEQIGHVMVTAVGPAVR
jgi:NAD(P)-dependent dehydrogenase (short-subunit alcohol dehydrogenase family)